MLLPGNNEVTEESAVKVLKPELLSAWTTGVWKSWLKLSIWSGKVSEPRTWDGVVLRG